MCLIDRSSSKFFSQEREITDVHATLRKRNRHGGTVRWGSEREGPGLPEITENSKEVLQEIAEARPRGDNARRAGYKGQGRSHRVARRDTEGEKS